MKVIYFPLLKSHRRYPKYFLYFSTLLFSGVVFPFFLLVSCDVQKVTNLSEHASALSDRIQWKAKFAPSTQEEADAWGRRLWGRCSVPNFSFSKTERFSCGSESHWIVIVFHEITRLEFVLLPGGEFVMGSPDTEVGRIHWEGPQRKVNIDPFLLARTEVSTFTYMRFKPGLLPHDFYGIPLSRYSQPVCWVEWEEAKGWCFSLGLRLPSEAEWEYACRAGTSTPFFWGETPDNIHRFANIVDQSALNVWPSKVIENYKERCSNLFSSANDGFGVSAPVGSYYPNAFGLFDMAGNVWEWCEDYWHAGYYDAPSDGGPVLKVSSDFVVRGGSWMGSAFFARAASRSHSFVGSGPNIGFRPAASVRPMIGDQ